MHLKYFERINWLVIICHLYSCVHREDSRLHACIVCASISCPNVRREAFRAGEVGEQMDSQVRDFLSNTKKGEFTVSPWFGEEGTFGHTHTHTHTHMHTGLSLDRSSNTLTLSPIFLWFVGDFEAYGGVRKFISPYLPPGDADYIAQHNPTIHYFTYNWNVNGVPPCTC